MGAAASSNDGHSNIAFRGRLIWPRQDTLKYLLAVRADYLVAKFG